MKSVTRSFLAPFAAVVALGFGAPASWAVAIDGSADCSGAGTCDITPDANSVGAPSAVESATFTWDVTLGGGEGIISPTELLTIEAFWSFDELLAGGFGAPSSTLTNENFAGFAPTLSLTSGGVTIAGVSAPLDGSVSPAASIVSIGDASGTAFAIWAVDLPGTFATTLITDFHIEWACSGCGGIWSVDSASLDLIVLTSGDGSDFTLVTPAPEPGTTALLGLGLAGIAAAARRRRRVVALA